jgi:hypothetical protein
LARVLIHVPAPNKHLVHFYSASTNRVRSSYRSDEGRVPPEPATDATHSRRASTKWWRELIYRVCEVDPFSWFPLLDRNPQTFVDIFHAKASDFREATPNV